MLRRASLGLFVGLFLAGCGGETLQLEGTMQAVGVMGHECWYLTTPALKTYEIYSEDPNLLRRGLKVRLEARKSTKDTVCRIGVLVDVLSYKVID